jgi:type IV secretory pathway TraG/TraD family ATPase VirD4
VSGTVTDLGFAALLAGLAVAVVAWSGAAAVAVATGVPVPPFTLAGLVDLAGAPGDPGAAWGVPMAAGAYWACAAVAAILAASVGWLLRRGWHATTTGHGMDPRRLPGTARPGEVTAAASRRVVLARAGQTRPSLHRPAPDQVGYLLGRCRGRRVWVSVEDSLLLLGPPRSGKGLHLVIPMLLDAPGAVVCTSTRPDNLAVTLHARRQVGPVAVFDPQQLAGGVGSGLRWSPVRGCQLPQTAMIRARGLAAGTGLGRGGVEGGDFWQGQTEAVLRGLLHAAALDGRPARDLYRWSLDAAAAADAVGVLNRPGAAEGWADALEQAVRSDPRTRDSIWLGVRQALAALADPRVLAAVSPRAGEEFHPDTFLRDRGTLYLLATASGAGASSALVAALVEDMAETARRMAAAAPGARLDPPLLLALDEIGNLAALPSLPALMADGGGTGITTLAVLQSLSQARDRWGEQQASTLWDAAIAKIVLGGGSNARDLADLSALVGDRDEHTEQISRDGRGARSTSTSLRRVPVLDPSRLRTLPFGTAVLLLRTAPPIVLDLHPWTRRRDAADLTAARTAVEDQLRRHADTTAPP